LLALIAAIRVFSAGGFPPRRVTLRASVLRTRADGSLEVLALRQQVAVLK
jgi:hypothetical protein